VAGGLMTTYLLQQQQPEPVDSGQAALQGLLAGFLGALVGAVVSAGFSPLTGVFTQRAMDFVASMPTLPPEMRDQYQQLAENVRNQSLAQRVLRILITLPVYGIASMLGALLGVAFFRKKTPPVVPPASSSGPISEG
jgi:hypothetical protein